MQLDQLFHRFTFSEENDLDRITLSNVSQAQQWQIMQPQAWMTTYLFSAWILHFIASVRRVDEISPKHHHLLILDGHNNHVTLEVVQEARATRLDLISLPSYTSYALQSLDVCYFKPFKQHFREYSDFCSSWNMH